jgi:alpha-glucoside transport system permease protein
MATLPAAAEPARRPAPVAETIPGGPRGPRRFLPVAIFMGPAAVLLGFIVVYPVFSTIIRSFSDKQGNFNGLGNYKTIFTTAEFLVIIRNNAIWVIVFPFLVTFIGLVFAVMTERIRWGTAFKTIVFAPMAISLFATGVIWRIVYETDPHRGVINSAIATVADTVSSPGLYTASTIKPISGLDTASDQSMISKDTVAPGAALKLGITGILPGDIPPGAQPAKDPQGAQGAVTGIVWRDFSPGGHIGVVDPGELGLPAMRVTLQAADGSTAGHATTDLAGNFRFDGVGQGNYHAVLDASNFKPGFQGVNWLGTQSITPTSSLGETGQALLSIPLIDIAEIVAMLWIWSGFAMVIIGAGLAALNREVLEAAKMDGATEWQTFRFVTLPLLMPVLIVVFITMIINVLKIFDIVLAISPEASLPQSDVIALKMWQVGFSPDPDRGLSSSLAVFLFLLVIPVLVINVRRIRG